jgi:hypothetical protein
MSGAQITRREFGAAISTFGVGMVTVWPKYSWGAGIDEMRRSIPEDATLWVTKRIHSVQLEIRRSTLEKE